MAKRNLKVLYYDDNRECDRCDNQRTCAIIETLSGEVFVICIECLKEIIKESEELMEE